MTGDWIEAKSQPALVAGRSQLATHSTPTRRDAVDTRLAELTCEGAASSWLGGGGRRKDCVKRGRKKNDEESTVEMDRGLPVSITTLL